jgi:hypothetical protein
MLSMLSIEITACHKEICLVPFCVSLHLLPEKAKWFILLFRNIFIDSMIVSWNWVVNWIVQNGTAEVLNVTKKQMMRILYIW